MVLHYVVCRVLLLQITCLADCFIAVGAEHIVKGFDTLLVYCHYLQLVTKLLLQGRQECLVHQILSGECQHYQILSGECQHYQILSGECQHYQILSGECQHYQILSGECQHFLTYILFVILFGLLLCFKNSVSFTTASAARSAEWL